MLIKDLHVEQSLEIILSHFKNESVYFTIKFNTPIGNIEVNPEKHFSFVFIDDIKYIKEDIKEGLNKDLPVIKVGCMESLFDISIHKNPEEENSFTFRIGIDLRKVLYNKPNFDGPCLTITVNRKSIEELVKYFEEIIKKYDNK
ncbi:MAG: hypothetical protein ACOY35_12645 [Bacillota bacterium]